MEGRPTQQFPWRNDTFHLEIPRSWSCGIIKWSILKGSVCWKFSSSDETDEDIYFEELEILRQHRESWRLSIIDGDEKSRIKWTRCFGRRLSSGWQRISETVLDNYLTHMDHILGERGKNLTYETYMSSISLLVLHMHDAFTELAMPHQWFYRAWYSDIIKWWNYSSSWSIIIVKNHALTGVHDKNDKSWPHNGAWLLSNQQWHLWLDNIILYTVRFISLTFLYVHSEWHIRAFFPTQPNVSWLFIHITWD